MALQGTFEVDFAKFETAVSQADVSLKTFQDNGDKVAASLTRVENSLTGVTIVQRATLAAQAVANLGEAGGITAGLLKLTDDELKTIGATAQQATEKLNALGQQVPPGIKAVADAAQELADKTQNTTSVVDEFVTKYFSVEAILGSVEEAYRSFVDFLSSSLEVYGEAQAAQTRLTTAIEVQGNLTPGLSAKYGELAAAYQDTTVNSKTLLESTEALLIQVGNVGPAQMDKALRAVTDLSAGLGIDLNSAAMLVAKAFEGKTQTMARYGVVLDQTRVQAEGITYVLDQIEDKFGGQAQSEAETYAGKVKQLGNSWDELKVTVGGAIANTALAQSVLRDLKKATDDGTQGSSALNAALGDIKAALPSWIVVVGQAVEKTAEFSQELNAAADAGERLSKMPPPKQFQLGPDVKDLPDFKAHDAEMHAGAMQQIEDWKGEDAAAAAYAKTVQAVADQMSGADVAKKIKELNDALVLLQRQGPLTGAELQRFGDAAAKLYEQGGTLPPVLTDIAVRFNGLLPPVKEAKMSLDDLGTRIYVNTLPAFVAMTDASVALQDKISQFPPVLANLGTKLKDGADGFKTEATAIDNYWKGMRAYAEEAVTELGDVEKAFKSMASDVGGSIGQVFGDFGKLTANLKTAKQANIDWGSSAGVAAPLFSDEADNTQKFGAAVESGAAIAAGALNVWSASANAGSKSLGALKGAMAGAEAGAMFGPWGAAIGAAGGALVGFIRNLNAGRDAVVNFANSMGGFDALHQQLSSLGAAGEQMWVGLTQGTGKSNPAQAAANIKTITDALAAQSAAANTSVQSLTSQISALGGAIDPALDPYIQKLQQANVLTADNAKALQGLEGNGVPTYQQLDALATKYNLSLAQMGPAFDESKVDAGFQTVIDDMDELQRGGVNVTAALTQVGTDGTTALSGLGTQVQSLIDQSMQYGVDVPANMQPAAQAMIDQGVLLDANGQKITDINQIKFGETMQTSLDALNTTLQTLITTLTGGGPTSLLGSLNAIGGVVVNPKIQPVYDTSQLPANMQTTQGAANQANLDLSAGSGVYNGPASPSTAPINIQVTSTLDGKTVAQNQVQYIPGALSAAGH